MDPGTFNTWGMDWAWGVPLIVLTVIFHASALGLINKSLRSILAGENWPLTPSAIPIVVMGGAALWATLLHAFECSLWAAAYRLLEALPDNRSAMLYSLNAITSYGHTDIDLAAKWQLLGALEALNGWILFGLTAAFLFTKMQKAWPHT